MNPPQREILPGVWRITTPLPFRPREVHAYLVALSGGSFLLVDGGIGTPEAWDALDAGVRSVTGDWGRVTTQVVTHMHMDHVGLAARVRAASGARLQMSRLDAERSAHAAAHPEEETEFRAVLLRRCGAPEEMIAAAEGVRKAADGLAPYAAPDVLLTGAEGDLVGAAGWRFLWTPGHTAGHLSLWRPADRVLIAGDAVLPGITPTIGVNRQRADPVSDYLQALDRLEGLGPASILPGHGEPLSDPLGRIAELRAATLGESETVFVLACERSDAWTLVERRYADRALPPPTRMLALRETLAHLDRAVRAGRLEEAVLDGTSYFSRP